jgi:DNA repair protein RadB
VTPVGLERRSPVARTLDPWEAFGGFEVTDDAIRLHRATSFRPAVRCAREDVEDVDAVVAALAAHFHPVRVGAFLSGPAQAVAVSEPIGTGCGAIDELLGGGFERGTVTQLYGPPAAGKTNLALSAAVEVAAAGDSALFVDTEGLPVERLEQLASARTDDVEDLASRIIISDVLDFEEQREAVRDAAEFAEQVELVVLDSATGFYRIRRSEDEEAGDALRAVAQQVTHLLSLARKHDLAVAITNQVFTDPETDRARPLGGHTLTHWSGVVLRIERFRGGNRRATLEKHQSKPAGDAARFKITGDGLHSVDETP